MELFDVIIVGGGPAGLHCAWVLRNSGLRILLLEKDESFGNKVCAGGISRKDLQLLDLPDHVMEHKITRTALHSRRFASQTDAPAPFMFTIDRREFGSWQRSRLEGTGITIFTGARVTEVRDASVIVNGQTEYRYKFLVGADGYSSIVRRYLGIPVKKVLIGIQYQVPYRGPVPPFELFLNGRLFKAWYAWIFPHRDTLAIGCVCDPKSLSPSRLRTRFHKWLDDHQIDISQARYESGPISYDYRGLRFGNVFLVGEAGGFASGLTGEGIYQSLVSGEAAARMILDPAAEYPELNKVLRYNRIQHRILRFLLLAGPLRDPLFNLLILLMNSRRVKAWIHKSFSG